MQAGYLLRLRLYQVRLQHIGEKVMIAIPLALVVERDDKQVSALQGSQHSPAAILCGHGVTQGTTQAVENGGLQQEIAHALGLAFENLPGQIIEHKAVTAGKGLDKTGGVGAPLHGEGG